MPETVHGGLDPAELRALGLGPEDVLDFSASVNPLGASEAVRAAIASADPSAYPDRECLELREALAARAGLSPDCVLPGNGSTELIHLLARAFLGLGVSCFVFTPAFGEYEAAAGIAGADTHTLRARAADGFRWNMHTAVEMIRSLRPGLVFLCNPNNPTGVLLSPGEVERVAEVAGDGLLVLDEAYMTLSDSPWDALPLLERGNVALLRSMTKDHALAGVRLGYLLAPESVTERVRRLQPSWSVSSIAQAAGVAALPDHAHVERASEVIAHGKACLEKELKRLGVPALPSRANFLLAEVGDAADLRRAMLRRGACVRDCASFGLPRHIRISVRTPEECRRLVAALEDALGERAAEPHGNGAAR